MFTNRSIHKPRTEKMPWRTSDGLGPAPVTVRKVGEPEPTFSVILAATHQDVIAASNAPCGSRGICGCGAPATKVQHPALGAHPKWIHDVNPEIQHPVANVRCITRP